MAGSEVQWRCPGNDHWAFQDGSWGWYDYWGWYSASTYSLDQDSVVSSYSGATQSVGPCWTSTDYIYFQYRFDRVVPTATAKARTFMPILGMDSTTNVNFPWQEVRTYYHDTSTWQLISQKWGANTVIQLPAQVTFSRVIVRLMSDQTMPLHLDSVFALKEFYLNPWIQIARVYSFVTLGVTYTDSISITGSMFDTDFTQGAGCQIENPRGTSVTSTTITAYFDQNSLSTNSVLVTSIFVQVGSSQNRPWSITINTASWSGTAWVYTDTEILTNKPGSFWHNLAAGSTIVVKVQITSPTNQMHICALKTFGYAYCQIQSMTVKRSGVSISSVALSPGESLTVTIPMTYIIDDEVTIVNNPFCAAGNTFQISVAPLGDVSVDMTTFSLDPATMTATYTLPIWQSSVALNKVFTFQSKDSRHSTAVFQTRTLSVAYGACQVSSLSKGHVTFLNGTSLGNTLYYQGSDAESFSFIYEIPQCNGFQPLLTQIDIKVSYLEQQGDLSQSPQSINQIEATWTSCKQSFNNMCFFYVPGLNSVNPLVSQNSVCYYSQGPSSTTNTFTAQIQITVTFFGYDNTLSLIQGSVFGTQRIVQTSCAEANFNLIQVYKYNNFPCPSNQLLDLRASINDTGPVYTIFQVTDSVSMVKTPEDGMSWCGARSFSISADESKKNSFLAEQLISEGCTSCLTLSVSDDGMTANITARIYDYQFTGQNFTFFLNLGILSYVGQEDQKIRQFEFTLFVDAIKSYNQLTTASLFPQFYTTIEHLVQRSCGDIFALPNIIDLRDPNPQISFQFGQASKFMNGSQSQISISNECLAGFYPILIKLFNGFGATTKYQFIIVIEKSQGLPEPTTDTQTKVKISQLFNGPIPDLTFNESKIDLAQGARIAYISYKGLITIELSSKVLVPINNSTTNSSGRSLSIQGQNTKMFLDAHVLQFSLISQDSAQLITNWTCVMFNESFIQIQIYFDHPYDVSADRQEQLEASILEPKVFIQQQNTSYLFRPGKTVVLRAEIPQQTPIDAYFYESHTNSTSKMVMKAFIIALYMMLIFDTEQRSAYMKTFLISVQTVVLVIKESTIIKPLSLAAYLDTLYEIFFVKITAEWWRVPAQKSNLLKELGGLPLSFSIILVALVVLQFTQWCLESRKKVQRCTRVLWSHIKWAAILNYYQLCFVNLAFAAFKTIHLNYTNTGDLLGAIILSKCQQMLLVVPGLYVYFTNANILERKTEILRLGAFYYNTGTWSRSKRLYRTFFFALLYLIVGIATLQLPFYMQNIALQLLFMANLIYLLVAKPHFSWLESMPDLLNGAILLLAQLFSLWLSRWTLSGEDRFNAGKYFCYFFLGAFGMSFFVCCILYGIDTHKLLQLYKRRKEYRNQKKLEMMLERKRQKVSPKEDQSVKIQDVFFSDGEDDRVIGQVEQELQLRRRTIAKDPDYISSIEEVMDESSQSENPQPEQQLQEEPKSTLIALKPKKSLLSTNLNNWPLKLSSAAKVQTLPVEEIKETTAPVQQNEMFESPRSQREGPSFTDVFDPDLQMYQEQGDFDTEAYERAYKVVVLQRKLDDKRRHAKDISELPDLADYDELMQAEKLAHPQVIRQVKRQLKIL